MEGRAHLLGVSRLASLPSSLGPTLVEGPTGKERVTPMLKCRHEGDMGISLLKKMLCRHRAGVVEGTGFE